MNIPVGIQTRHGIFVATFNETGLCRLEFPKKAIKIKTMNKLTGHKKNGIAIQLQHLRKYY
tara:strand:+ start:591 stop:773 length:183 start_codon:yes stop_codon:yes gene_type:complete